MNASKIIGWLVFFIGLGLMAWALFHSYDIFTSKAPVPEFFKTSSQDELGRIPITQVTIEDPQAQMTQVIQQQLKDLIPTESIIRLLNLAVWSMLAFILLSGGSQIAGLGIKLVRG